MKKRIPGILLSLALMIVMMPVFGMTAYAWDGGGTQDNPWKIGPNGTDTVTAWLENKEGSETETILHIEGIGEMADFSSENPAPWKEKNITSADVGQGVTSIGDAAFYGCSDLVTVTFTPAAVDQQMKIGTAAFDRSSQILGYGSGNTRLCCDDSVLQAGESLLSYNGKTLVWNISYDLWVKGTLVTETNRGNVLGNNTVSFTPEAGSSPPTLTLKGATIEDGYIEGERQTLDVEGTAVLTINRAPLTVTAEDKTKVYGDADPEFTYTVSGIISGETVNDAVTGALTRILEENVGTYEITQGTLTGTANYEIAAYTPATFTITLIRET